MSDETVTPPSETPPTPTEQDPPTLITETPPPADTTTEVEEPKPEVVAEPVVPLTEADLTIPEGYEVVEPLKNEFLEILNDTNLSAKDRSNALLLLHQKTLDAAQEADRNAFTAMQDEWKNEAKADPDIGGPKLQATLTNVAKLIDEYGDDNLRQVFNYTGAGNNVHIIKFLNKVAVQLTEGSHVGGSPRGELTPDEKAQRLYPSMPR